MVVLRILRNLIHSWKWQLTIKQKSLAIFDLENLLGEFAYAPSSFCFHFWGCGIFLLSSNNTCQSSQTDISPSWYFHVRKWISFLTFGIFGLRIHFRSGRRSNCGGQASPSGAQIAHTPKDFKQTSRPSHPKYIGWNCILYQFSTFSDA